MNSFRPAVVMFALLAVLTGVLYPLAVTAVAHLLFPAQAAGSLIVSDGRVIGSRLIGQAFGEPQYFWGRPSATAEAPYNAMASGGSNQGPLNPALLDAVRSRVAALRAADPANALPVPVDLVTASASGLDPHMSIAAAHYQAARVARTRGLPQAEVDALIEGHSHRSWLGEPQVDVLALNRALDAMARSRTAPHNPVHAVP